MFIGMLFNPLRQIADKFNEMQMGMIAANRVFDILDSESDVQNGGNIVAKHFKGDILLIEYILVTSITNPL
jgi:ABC-type multidrug transport system fused ATPase/permease subunit